MTTRCPLAPARSRAAPGRRAASRRDIFLLLPHPYSVVGAAVLGVLEKGQWALPTGMVVLLLTTDVIIVFLSTEAIDAGSGQRGDAGQGRQGRGLLARGSGQGPGQGGQGPRGRAQHAGQGRPGRRLAVDEQVVTGRVGN